MFPANFNMQHMLQAFYTQASSSVQSSGARAEPTSPASLLGGGYFGHIGNVAQAGAAKLEPASPGGSSPAKLRRCSKFLPGTICAVCQDLATGFHYGVAACHGCKTFFRRTIVRGLQYNCQKDACCVISKNMRNACRYCRFNKCAEVGMDAMALQGKRERGQPKMKSVDSAASSPATDRMPTPATPMDQVPTPASALDQTPAAPADGQMQSEKKNALVDSLTRVEELCNQLRNRALGDDATPDMKEILAKPSLLHSIGDLQIDQSTQFTELRPATMTDVQAWNVRELRICLEWAKTFEAFQKLSEEDKMALLKNFAFSFNILNRLYYSLDYGADKIVYPSGAYVERELTEALKLSGCRPTYCQQMDSIMLPLREMKVDVSEFVLLKAVLFFNPDAQGLSPEAKKAVAEGRAKLTMAMHDAMVAKNGTQDGVQRYSRLLLMTSSLQHIVDVNAENMHCMNFWSELEHHWKINAFVKQLCMH